MSRAFPPLGNRVQHYIPLLSPEKFNPILLIQTHTSISTPTYLLQRLTNPISSPPHPRIRISAQLNVAFVSNRYYVVQEQHTQASHDANYAFIVSSLLQFQQLMYQGKPDTPFNTHLRTIRVAITSLLMYGLAHEAQLRFRWARLPPSYASIVGCAVRLVRFIGSVLVASLASVLVPDSAQPVLYLIYVLPSAAVFFQWFKRRVMNEVGESNSWIGPLRQMIRSRRVQGDRYTLPRYI